MYLRQAYWSRQAKSDTRSISAFHLYRALLSLVRSSLHVGQVLLSGARAEDVTLLNPAMESKGCRCEAGVCNNTV